MRIDVGEGPHNTTSEDLLGYGVSRSESQVGSVSSRRSSVTLAPRSLEDAGRSGGGVGGTILEHVSPTSALRPDSKVGELANIRGSLKVALSFHGGNKHGLTNIRSDHFPFQQQSDTGAAPMTGLVPIDLKSNSLTPLAEEGNDSPGSSTPPADTGGDPCPCCSSSHALLRAGDPTANPRLACRCGRAPDRDKACCRYTGGEPVAAAGALPVEGLNRGGGFTKGAEGMVPPRSVKADEEEGISGCESTEPAATPSTNGVATAEVQQQVLQQQHQGGLEQQAFPSARATVTRYGAETPLPPPSSSPPAVSERAGSCVEAWPACVPQRLCATEPAVVGPRVAEVSTPCGGIAEGAGCRGQHGCLDVVSGKETDTMDRLALSLAQARRLTMHVQARQTELLGRPKRRPHPSAKKEASAHLRKIKPKTADAKRQELGVKIEEMGVKPGPTAALDVSSGQTPAPASVSIPATAPALNLPAAPTSSPAPASTLVPAPTSTFAPAPAVTPVPALATKTIPAPAPAQTLTGIPAFPAPAPTPAPALASALTPAKAPASNAAPAPASIPAPAPVSNPAPAPASNPTPAPASNPASAQSSGSSATPSSARVQKQRLLIKIPRRVVTAATAHAAEIAAAAAAQASASSFASSSASSSAVCARVKDEQKETAKGCNKRGKGKGGIKRARPLAGTRASPPPPPPPTPATRQEPPPGYGPLSPTLSGIFGREIDEAELALAEDGLEHLETSQSSRRLSALSCASPEEIASHVQSLRLDYLVQKVRPILTKLMAAGTGPQRGLFNVPVDPIKLGIPDYFKRVPRPMDLGTIKSRLLSMSYTGPDAFASDVRLVFTNAIGFNPESHFVHTWAVQLLNEFDQEYSKQVGKLDEGWAKSLSHSCQLCQGQTCILCGDKCLKLEPPVIICQHCNKRVVRGGVYHITRDGCRLWCSRCHPSLPPELPTDGEPESIGGDDSFHVGDGGSSSGGAEAGAEGGGTCDVLSPSSVAHDHDHHGPPRRPSLTRSDDVLICAGAGATAGSINAPASAGTEKQQQQSLQAAGGTCASEVADPGAGGSVVESGSQASSAPGGSSVGGRENSGAIAEGPRAPLKRDLLRRKFDEEISEPWVQCDRCNSWVHQVCALFNARANVGEARFMCPLCRLRGTKAKRSTAVEAGAEAASVVQEAQDDDDSQMRRKRPKSMDGNGHLTPPPPLLPIEVEEAPASASPAAAPGSSPSAGTIVAAAVIPSATAFARDKQGATSTPAAPATQVSESLEENKGVTPMEDIETRPSLLSTPGKHNTGVVVTTPDDAAEACPAPAPDRMAVVSGGDAELPPAFTPTPICPPSLGLDPLPARLGQASMADDAVPAGNHDTMSATDSARASPGDAAGVSASVGEVCASQAMDVEKPDEVVGADVGAEAAGDPADGTAVGDRFDVYAATSLPRTPLSRYVEFRVRQRLKHLGKEGAAAAETVCIRLISNVEATCEVHPVLRETFCCKDGHGVGDNKNDVPEHLKYRSKALSMFQRVDGVEVCLFSMYVQEYGADAPYFNARRAYISYLDSVEYFRPRKHRTAVYHEILVAYLDWLRRRGFKAAHIWSCPPQRGNNFIFWCHPLHQKTPTRDRLSGWYSTMLKRALQLGVASKVTTLDKTHFTEVERIGILLKNRRTSAAASAAASLAGVKGPDDLPLRPEIPVIFEGDFWTEEAVRLARAVERKDDTADDGLSPLELCSNALEELIRHQQGAPFTAPVDPLRDRCPDYLFVIKQPMDLGTVAEKLDAMRYHDAGAFVTDVRLIFDNARTYNPPKHPIHVAASKLSKVFDKAVRALESAVNRLPGMHEIGLEHLVLEEPTPPMPGTPTAGTAPTPAPGACVGGATPPFRPTAPGKTSIPWAYNAIGPLSQLARKTWAAHSAPAVRTVGGLPTMHEDSPSEPGIPSALAPSRSMSSGGGSDFGGESGGPPASERFSRTGSTSVMSVSEFYGPSGARMLQRRGSAASYASLAESYGEGEAALSRLMSLEGEQQQQQQKKTDSAAGEALGAGAVMGVGVTPTVKQTSAAVAVTTNPWSGLSCPSQPVAAPCSSSALLPGNGEAVSAVVASTPTIPPVITTVPAEDPPRSSPNQAFLPPAATAATEASASAVSDISSLASRPVLPPPLTLEAPHPAGRNVSLPWMNTPSASIPAAQAVVDPGQIAGQSRDSIHRAVSVDSGSCASALSFAHGTTNLARCVSNPGSSGGARSTASGGIAHSPRLRAKSMDASSGGRKKGKGKKGPGSAVMGKADKIGRMLQSLSRAVTRISKDLLVVSLGDHDRPAKPPHVRGQSTAMTKSVMMELEAWHASSGLEGVLTPDCHDPDPAISRALVDARHTFLEMCQFRHYQFDTLRRAKHSSAMVLYHLHRPENRSLNPFCSRCHRPVRFVRYHCGVCNYDLCAECDEEVGTKCEDSHPLTPYRVTFSSKETEDAETSPGAGPTPATGDSDLSPARPRAPGGRGGEKTGGVKSKGQGSRGSATEAAAATPPSNDSPATDQVEQKSSLEVLPPAGDLAEGEQEHSNGGAGRVVGHSGNFLAPAFDVFASAVPTSVDHLENAPMQIDVVVPAAAAVDGSVSAVNVPGEGHVAPEVRGSENQQQASSQG